MQIQDLKVALVCDWLTVPAGAERVIFEFHELFPKAPIYTTLFMKERFPQFKDADIRESYLRFIPGARSAHQLFFPLMPRAFERMDFSDYDIVISSSHSAAKGIITKPETLHVSYCHSPMRYVWDQSHEYQERYKSFRFLRFLYQPVLHRIRMWDRLAAERVDVFIANSNFVKDRIRKYYKRDSHVIWPPVDLQRFIPSSKKTEDYLAVGRLTPYKRFDLVVDAANKNKISLKIVGEGPELGALKKKAGPTVEFLGRVSEAELPELYQKSKALLFPQVEDFGIVPLEAMASGTPVIAFKAGGALDTIEEGVNGLFFEEQSVESLSEAIEKFEKKKWDADKVAHSVQPFSRSHFKMKFLHFLEKSWKEHKEMLA